MTWLDLTWLDLTWLDLTWLDLTWLDLTWLDLTWLDLTWLCFALLCFALLCLLSFLVSYLLTYLRTLPPLLTTTKYFLKYERTCLHAYLLANLLAYLLTCLLAYSFACLLDCVHQLFLELLQQTSSLILALLSCEACHVCLASHNYRSVFLVIVEPITCIPCEAAKKKKQVGNQESVLRWSSELNDPSDNHQPSTQTSRALLQHVLKTKRILNMMRRWQRKIGWEQLGTVEKWLGPCVATELRYVTCMSWIWFSGTGDRQILSLILLAKTLFHHPFMAGTLALPWELRELEQSMIRHLSASHVSILSECIPIPCSSSRLLWCCDRSRDWVAIIKACSVICWTPCDVAEEYNNCRSILHEIRKKQITCKAQRFHFEWGCPDHCRISRCICNRGCCCCCCCGSSGSDTGTGAGDERSCVTPWRRHVPTGRSFRP